MQNFFASFVCKWKRRLIVVIIVMGVMVIFVLVVWDCALRLRLQVAMCSVLCAKWDRMHCHKYHRSKCCLVFVCKHSEAICIPNSAMPWQQWQSRYTYNNLCTASSAKQSWFIHRCKSFSCFCLLLSWSSLPGSMISVVIPMKWVSPICHIVQLFIIDINEAQGRQCKRR